MSGEPIRFSQEIFDEICAQIAEGKSVKSICLKDGMPTERAFYKWLEKAGNEHLVQQYAHARESQADTLFNDCLDIADQYEQTAEKLEGGTDHIQRAKLRIDTRKWMAGKLAPKKYGEKVAIGGDKDMDPIQTEERGQGAAKVLAALEAIAERSGTISDPDA